MKPTEVTRHKSLTERRVTGKHRMGGLGAWMVWIATVPLWRYLLQRPLCSQQLGSGAVDACGRSSLPLSRDVSIVLRRFVVPLGCHPGGGLPQRCYKDWVVCAFVSLISH